MIEPPDQSLHVSLRHRRATSRGGRRVFPNVQEYARSSAGDRGRIMFDDDAPFIEIVVSPHFLGTAPIDRDDARSVPQPVVVTRFRIVDPLGLCCQGHVRNPDPNGFIYRCVAEGVRKSKDPGWGAIVAFLFFWSVLEIEANKPEALSESVFSQDNGKTRPVLFPGSLRSSALEGLQDARR